MLFTQIMKSKVKERFTQLKTKIKPCSLRSRAGGPVEKSWK
jgi:hypothetical protein